MNFNKRIIKILFFTFFICTPLIFAEPSAEKTEEVCGKDIQKDPTFIEQLSSINLNSFKREHSSWSTNSMEEYLKLLAEHSLNPSPVDKRELSFHVFREIEKKEDKSVAAVDTTIWKDLDLFCGQHDKTKYVANLLNRANTEMGTISFYQLLAQPIYDTEKIEKRQEVIKTLLNKKELFDDLNQAFSDLEKPENILLAFFWGDHFVHNVKQCSLFSLPGFKFLNKSDNAVLLKSAFSHVENMNSVYGTVLATAALISYAGFCATNRSIIPEKAKKVLGVGREREYWGASGPIVGRLCRVDNRWIHALVLAVGGVYCGLRIKRCAEWFKDFFLLEKTIHIFTIQLAKFINACSNVYEIIKEDPTLNGFEEFKEFTSFFEAELEASKELKDFFELASSGTFKTDPTFFLAHKGKAARFYILMHDIKEKMEKMLAGFGKIDAYLSIAKLYKEFENEKIKFSFPEFVQTEKPSIELKNFWHPLIDKESVVTNSITLGKDDNRSNIVLTGPNAGGKSIALKSIVLSVLMAHTLGIVPAEKMVLTPFSSISTYLNITDDVGAGQSLFKSEALRCQELVDKIEKSPQDKFHFQVFDEVFNGTTPQEGMAAAYGVAQYLGGFENNICLIATHFYELTELEKATGKFENYKVSVNYIQDGFIEYPYKLEKGTSNQHVAFDILRNQGFTGSIIDMAKNRLAG